MRYIYETHCHTSEVSPCGQLTAKEIVEKYKAAKYSGIVITDHFCRYSLAKILDSEGYSAAVDYFLTGYRAAKEAAGSELDILLGMELRFNENLNDYLVLGITEDFLYEYEDILDMNPQSFSELAREKGILIFQAHPFRNSMTVINPKFLDGVEVFNGHFAHDSRNNLAEIWAEKYNLLKCSGSDMHEVRQIPRGGIISDERITDTKKLVEILKKNPELVKNY